VIEDRAPWKPGSRIRRIGGSHSYGILLPLILITFVFTASAPDEEWARDVLLLVETALFATALWASGLAWMRSAVAPVVFGVAVATLQLVAGGSTFNGVVWTLNGALIAGTIAVIALGVIDQGEINRQSLTGAVCIYLLLGFMFMFVYGAIAAFDSDPFFAQGGDGTPSIRLYFSYVTLATLGYGDYTAAESLGRSVSVLEALCGQLYLVTVVALMVGHYGQRRAR
jgi:voltage-gated potassium channel